MTVHLTDEEQAVLLTFNRLTDEDPDGAWSYYHSEIIQAGGFRADGICRNLRQRKMLNGQGRGQHASYWISDKGRKVLNETTS